MTLVKELKVMAMVMAMAMVMVMVMAMVHMGREIVILKMLQQKDY